MKHTFRKLMNTFSDLGSVRDESEDTGGPGTPSARSETSTTRRTFSFSSASSKRKEKDREVIKLLTDLSDERKRTLDLQDRLQGLLGENTEMRASAAVEVDEERRMRRMAEARMKEAKQRVKRAEKALADSEGEKELLELELMEAASDVLAHRAFRQAYQERIKGERAAWQLLEQRDTERLQLEERLKSSEMQRLNLLQSLLALQQNGMAKPFNISELLMDDGLDYEMSPKTPQTIPQRGSIGSDAPSHGYPLEPIIEYEEAIEYEEDPIESPPSEQDANGFSDHAKPEDDEDLNFGTPTRSTSPLPMHKSGENGFTPPTPAIMEEHPGLKAHLEAQTGDALMVSMSSDSSEDSIMLTDRSGLITVGDYILESEACDSPPEVEKV